MAKITYRKVNAYAWIYDTWLAPYAGYTVKVVKYLNGRIDLWLDGHLYKHCEGSYQYINKDGNCYDYTILKLVGRPRRA